MYFFIFQRRSQSPAHSIVQFWAATHPRATITRICPGLRRGRIRAQDCCCITANCVTILEVPSLSFEFWDIARVRRLLLVIILKNSKALVQLTLIAPGEVKVDLTNFERQIADKLLMNFFYSFYSCRNVLPISWNFIQNYKNDVFMCLLMRLCIKNNRPQHYTHPPPLFSCWFRPP